MRRDRHFSNKSAGGGVCAYIHHKIPAERLHSFESDSLESLWINLKPFRLPRHISTILFGVIYHPPSAKAEDNDALIEHISSNVNLFLNKYPDSLVVITGDFNPCSTNISLSPLMTGSDLTQLIKLPTRGDNILDWCLVNKPKQFKAPERLPNIGSSDHYAMLINPKDQDRNNKSRNSPTYKREMKDSNIRAFGRWICNKSWDDVLQQTNCKTKFDLFYDVLMKAINRYLPLRKQKTTLCDKPWLTNKLKLFILRRQSSLAKYGKQSQTFKFWRNKVQVEVKKCKEIYYKDKVQNLKSHGNISRWWKEVKKLGCITNQVKWPEQLLGEQNSSINELVESINNYFVNLSADYQPLEPETINCSVEIPSDLFIDQYKMYHTLKKIKVHKTPGPDDIPNRILRDFALELSPVLSDIYNSTLKEGRIPELLRSSIVSPIPKIIPPKKIEEDLRPISLTPQIAKVMEGFILEPLLDDITDKIDPCQFAMKGRSTTQALVLVLHNILEALDRGGCSVRAFFADFSKGFDLVNHNVLIEELEYLEVRPSIVRWIRAFLTERKQCVRVHGICSSSKYLNGGIPQGTKLGPILFAVLVNRLVRDWNLRVKFVDDLATIEIIPRCSPSLTPLLVNEVQLFADSRGMRLNPKKCKEMVIDFLHYRLPCENVLMVGQQQIERVTSHKLLGVYLSCDLLWNTHVEYIVKKANKRLYILRLLRKTGVGLSELVTVYVSVIRPTLNMLPLFGQLFQNI